MTDIDAFLSLVQRLLGRGVRFVQMGVSGVNLYARSAHTVFTTKDRDLFLPPDPQNTFQAWLACADAGLELWCSGEPLGAPLDVELAQEVGVRQALVQATDRKGLDVDLSFVMGHYDFESVWRERRTFQVGGVEIPVARLAHIVESKAQADRPKDRLFLASYADALRDLIDRDV